MVFWQKHQNLKELGDHGAVLQFLQTLGVPDVACPAEGRYGKYSYTVRSENAVVVEVLVRQKAFRIHRTARAN